MIKPHLHDVFIYSTISFMYLRKVLNLILRWNFKCFSFAWNLNSLTFQKLAITTHIRRQHVLHSEFVKCQESIKFLLIFCFLKSICIEIGSKLNKGKGGGNLKKRTWPNFMSILPQKCRDNPPPPSKHFKCIWFVLDDRIFIPYVLDDVICISLF